MLSLQSLVSIPDIPASGHLLGIDIGLDKFLATSQACACVAGRRFRHGRTADSELIERPRFLTKLHSELKLTSDPEGLRANARVTAT